MSKFVIGVVIVTYGSSDVIEGCLDSLVRAAREGEAKDLALRVTVVDNASPDDTVARLRSWSYRTGIPLDFDPGAGATGRDRISVGLLESCVNLGFAGGVNRGLAALMRQPDVDLFWILNPDCRVPRATPEALRRAAVANPGFGLMGGRILYEDGPNLIQSDGGRVRNWTGICVNLNQGLAPAEAVAPGAASLDFISGAHLVASRAFVESVGFMREDYFLYYEEVDWAMRRGDLPIVTAPEALVYHIGGTSIGTGSVVRRASGFANYFNYRNRMRFVRRFRPWALPAAYLYSLTKTLRLAMLGAWPEFEGAFRGLHGMSSPRAVTERVSPEAHGLAFGTGRRRQLR